MDKYISLRLDRSMVEAKLQGQIALTLIKKISAL